MLHRFLDWLRSLPGRFRAWLSSFRRKQWVRLYRWSGEHVGTAADEYWDQHYFRVVKHRLRELGNTDLGLNFVKTVFLNEPPPPDMGRDIRSPEREVRDER